MLALLPASTEAKNHAPSAQIIKRGSLASQQSGMAKRDRRDQWTKMDPLRVIGQVGQRNHHFQRILVWRIRVSEMIRAKKAGKTEIFYFRHQSLPMRPGQTILPLNHKGTF